MPKILKILKVYKKQEKRNSKKLQISVDNPVKNAKFFTGYIFYLHKNKKYRYLGFYYLKLKTKFLFLDYNKMIKFTFEWDEDKNKINTEKHQVSFNEAQKAFLDLDRVIIRDIKHSNEEPRLFCIGKVQGEILTVRFIVRNNIIRIFGAGYWRKGKKIYEEKNKIH